LDTRARILAAALKEFAAKGYDGARVEAIARRAHVTKGLIFYYFPSKESLFRELAERRIAPRDDLAAANAFDWALGLFGLGEETLDWVRFFLWEGLSIDAEPLDLLMQDRRTEGWQRRVAWVRQQQAAGNLPKELDAAQLTLFVYMLGVFPLMVPQLVYMITGRVPTDPEFRAEFEAFVRGLEQRLAPDQTVKLR
jgi:TetR/AcrR family transcriptional regulator